MTHTHSDNLANVVHYCAEGDGWWAESCCLPGWSAAADSLEECQRLAVEAFEAFKR